MTFAKKDITLQFTLNNGDKFDDEGNTILTVSNIKCTLSYSVAGYFDGSSLDLKLYGLSMRNMSAISYKGISPFGTSLNELKVWVGDNLLFYGGITGSFADFNEMPEPVLMISASPTAYYNTATPPPITISQQIALADLVAGIAKTMGFNFVNQGVDTQVSSGHYPGDPVNQIREICTAHNVNFEFANRNLTIWPKNKKRDDVKLLVNTQHGLIGYPAFATYGIIINTSYSPLIETGRIIQLETDLPNASGDWGVAAYEHLLSTHTPGGPWQTTIHAMLPWGE